MSPEWERRLQRARLQAWLQEQRPLLWIFVVLVAVFSISMAWATTPSETTSFGTGVIESLHRRQTDNGQGKDHATVGLADGSKIVVDGIGTSAKIEDEVRICKRTKYFLVRFESFHKCHNGTGH